MTNILQYASVFQSELDAQMIEEATSGWMEPNSALVKYNGGSEIRIADIVMDGLADYDRNDGFADGSITLTFRTHQMTQDRGRSFQVDEMDVDETNFVLIAGTAMGEFQRTRVAPEVDAYRYSKIATLGINGSKARGGYSPVASSLLKELRADIARVQDIVGTSTQLVITMPIPVASVFDESDALSKNLNVVEFKKGDITLTVKGLDTHPILRVPSDRMKTAYQFYDGVTSGQEAGGFVPAAGAKSINWLITARNAPIAVSKTDKMRIFDPETNQKARAWKMDYRKYHDLWIPRNKLDAVFVNCKEALS